MPATGTLAKARRPKDGAGLSPPTAPDMNVPKIGSVIQRYRKELRMTLEQVAEISNISRSMLSQIERGETNPTYAVVWRLTRALGISIGDLARATIDPLQGRDEFVPASGIPEFRSPEGKWRMRILSPPVTAGDTEWYQLELKAKSAIESQPHRPGAWEHLTALDGPLNVMSGGQHFSVEAGDTARYAADVAHAISNPSDKVVRAILVTLYR